MLWSTANVIESLETIAVHVLWPDRIGRLMVIHIVMRGGSFCRNHCNTNSYRDGDKLPATASKRANSERIRQLFNYKRLVLFQINVSDL